MQLQLLACSTLAKMGMSAGPNNQPSPYSDLWTPTGNYDGFLVPMTVVTFHLYYTDAPVNMSSPQDKIFLDFGGLIAVPGFYLLVLILQHELVCVNSLGRTS